MALSGTWTFTVTRDDIIREAMLNIGAIGEAETPTAQEVTDCARKLNMLVKQWMSSNDQAPGLKMWERQRGELFLSQTQGVYSLGPTGDFWAASAAFADTFSQTYAQTQTIAAANTGDTTLSVQSTDQMAALDKIGIVINGDLFWTTIFSVDTETGITLDSSLPAPVSIGAYVFNYTVQAQRPLAIVTCVLRDVNNNDTPMNVMTLQDYEILPTKTQTTFQADPTAYYYESQFTQADGLTVTNGNGVLYLDIGGAQDVTKHLHIVYMRSIMDLNNPTDNVEYPQQWYRALCWGLSREIAGMFDAVWTQDMDLNYRESAAIAREADAETTSVYFQPNSGDPFSP